MKKKPERTCAVCRTKQFKSALIRIVQNEDEGLIVDASGKMNGRGTYVCANELCYKDKRAKKQLAAALKIEISESDFENLQKKIENHIEFLKREQKIKQ